MRKINEAGLELEKQFEGLKLEAYLCPAGVWTIGHGHTDGVEEGMTCTKEEAAAWLEQDNKTAEQAVNVNVKVEISDNQFSALVCFIMNVGAAAFRKSTLLKKINTHDPSAADEFLRWNKAKNKVLAGLTRRRKAERELFLS